MADRTEDLMNLDLNLGPGSPPSPVIGPGTGPSSGESVNVIGWESTYVREALRQRSRHRWRWRQGQLPLGPHSLRLMVEPDVNGGDPGVGSGVDGEDNGGTILAGEGSVTAELRSHEVVKTCENNVIPVENDSVAEKDVEKPNSEEGSFFDCNICFDLAKEPVVTCCGHLFCWPCIYRWLQIHSEAKECPVCKGEVSVKNVTPIYGRGNHIHEPEDDLDLGIKIPGRPSARRVESLRQTIQRTASSFPMEEMIRRLGARFELTRDYFQLPNADGDAEMPTRASILNRFMTSRALLREQNPPIAPDEVVDLTQDRPEILPRRLPPLTYRRGQYVDAYLHRSPPRRSQDVQPPPVDDRDSFSSIAAAIHGESQTMDTAVEIDSLVSISTSTSRRRHDPSRTSDMDSGDSRAPRRRRLN
uniref:E3 ubiquitin-protein ligase RMA n=1 Tax=Chenopodium quinoa TaxID=63459 RepID=A0A803LM42_CHEQI